ncbi:MAG: ABC transporter substrate-binding protein [Spirochaetales bacterium]|nr:ABC transporter substrate-binding protein [Spirochaetales bacterium]
MKKLLNLIALLILAAASLWAEQTVTDMVGRSVTLPDSDEISLVMSGNPTASVFLYSLAPELLGNWNFKMSSQALKIFPPQYAALPVHGTIWGNGKKANDEEILKLNPDVIVLSDTPSSTVGELCDTVQERLGIPVLFVSCEMDLIPQAYEFMGEVLGREDRASLLGDYAGSLMVETKDFTEGLSKSEKKRVYYSLSDQGLNTYPAGVSNAALIELCGAENVITLPYTRKAGPMQISFEEVVKGDPEIIIAGHATRTKPNDGKLYEGGKWAALDSEVFIIPFVPFNAFDKPASVNQLGGIIWLRKILYPESFDYDLEEEMARFYSLFFHI